MGTTLTNRRSSVRFIPSWRGLCAIVAILSVPVLSGAADLDTSLLPAPVFEPEPGYVDLYWKAWELAHDHIATDDGAVQSPFMDEGRVDGKISLWESAFTALFTRYAPDHFPGIESLNEYYAQIHDNATSSQTIEHKNNPPILAWAEWEHFLMTGDKARVEWVLEEKEYLQKHFAWFHDNQQRQWNQWGKGYGWTHAASGMVNSPRGRHAIGKDAICEGNEHSWTCGQPSLIYPSGETFSWLDAMAQQCLAAKCIHLLAAAIGNEALAAQWKETWDEYKAIIEEFYYHGGIGYKDASTLTLTSPQVARTAASFWTFVSEAASMERAEETFGRLVMNPGFFGDAIPFPSLIPGDIDADINGRGRRGGVYPPLVYMGIRGLHTYGYTGEATRLARNMVEHMYRTWVEFEPHTIWEAYSPSERKPSTDTGGVDFVHPDYVGWSGVGPISLLIEYVLGFHTIDANTNRVAWNLHWPEKHGIKRLSFGSVRTDIVYENGTVTATTNEAYTLVINGEEHSVSAGEPVTISVDAPPAPAPVPSPVRYPVGQGTRIEAEGEVEYPADTGNTYFQRLCEWPWRFICECSQGWKVWIRKNDGPYEFPPLPSGNALLIRLAYGGNAQDPVKWILSVNGEEHSRHEGFGDEWQYVLIRDVPLTKESNTITFERTSVNFFSVDFVEVVTLDETGTDAYDPPAHRVSELNQPIQWANGEVRFAVSENAMTTVDLLDISGRRVAGLVNRYMPAGRYRSALPERLRLSGTVYIVRLKTGNSVHSRMMIPGVQ